MSLLYRYWIKEFLRLFLIVQTIILILAVVVDYLSRLERFLNSDITLVGAAGYILLKVPFFFVQFIPATTLLAAVVLFGLMNRNNELLALKSSGISVYHLVKPAIIAGLVLTALVFAMNETLVPATMSKSNYIKAAVIKKRKMATARKDIWIKSGNRFIHINYFNLTRQSIGGITVTRMNEAFQIAHRVDARYGIFKNGVWHLSQVVEQTFDRHSDRYVSRTLDRMKIRLDIVPEELTQVVKKSDEMSYGQLKQLAERIEKEGYDATRYRVDLHGKLAFPFICLIMALTGAATGMRGFVRSNMALGIGIGVLISFSYWVAFGFCMSLGYGGVLPAPVAAWAANFIFLCFSVIYLINAQ